MIPLGLLNFSVNDFGQDLETLTDSLRTHFLMLKEKIQGEMNSHNPLYSFIGRRYWI